MGNERSSECRGGRVAQVSAERHGANLGHHRIGCANGPGRWQLCFGQFLLHHVANGLAVDARALGVKFRHNVLHHQPHVLHGG